MFKKVILNTTAQIIGKGITASITLLITLIIGKTLGPKGYGDFTKIFVFVGYFYTLADFGLNTIYIKVAKEEKTEHLKVLFGLRILIGITLAIVATAIAQLLPYNAQTATGFNSLVKVGIAIASLTIITQAIFISANAFFQKILRYDLSTVAATTSYVFVLTTAVIVANSTKSLLGYTAAYVVGGIVLTLAAYLIIARRTKTFFTPSFNVKEFLVFLRPAWPVGVALLFNLIYFRIDVFILSNYRTSEEVGLYGLAYQFFEAALAVPIFFSNAIYPPLATLYLKNKSDFTKQVKNWTMILLGVSVLFTAALITIAYLIPKIYDARFQGSVKALQILALGMPFFFLSALLWHLLIIFNKQKYLTGIYALGAVFNIVTNLILIPKYGYMAAATTTVASEALILLLLTGAVLKLKGENS